MTEESATGLCPVCLMSLAMNWTAQTQPVAPPLKVLTPEELAPHFPQLEVLELIGRGGMGVVYKAKQKSLNRYVALKLLAPDSKKDGSFAGRFAKEAQALAKMDHPNIVTVYDFGESGGFFYLLMEYVDGVNLRQAMRAEKFTPEQALAIVPPVCEALQYAHEHGIVHRDIKPENLLMNKQGRVKIADFGIAKIIAHPAADDDSRFAPGGATGDTVSAGTPQYMAPEQRQADAKTDHRSDIYSLGVVLYELLTGELPGATLQPLSKRIQVDVKLDEIVLRALEVRPEMRYQTAGEMRTQLAEVRLAGDGAASASIPVQNRKSRRLASVLWGAASAAALVFILLAARKLLLPSRPLPRVAAASQMTAKTDSPPLPTGPQEVKLTYFKEGGYDKTRSYRPNTLRTLPDKPANVTRLPEGLTEAYYGQLKMGPTQSRTAITVLIDDIPEKSPRIFVDTNANGDLTDDPPAQNNNTSPTGTLTFSGHGWVDLPYGPMTQGVRLNMRTMVRQPSYPPRPKAAPMLVYHLDCFSEGEVRLADGRAVKVLLKDANSDGDFTTDPMLYADLGDGSGYSARKGVFRALDAIQILGSQYEIRNLSPTGESFTWIKSSAPILAEPEAKVITPPFELSLVQAKATPGPGLLAAGMEAPAFDALAVDRRPIRFPFAYKGKVVLLDFWSTWCGPCLKEIPYLKATYQKHHQEGLEIISISLDENESLLKLLPFITDHQMTWPQICEGRSFSSSLCRLYKVSGIPAAYLVDGDTGIILATQLRGETIQQEVAKALALKRNQPQ
ncbi:protein kinase [Prosthecobacter sp. SYSU 5D2]